MLGEASTTRITKGKNAQGIPENKQAARQGGTIAGNAKRELEQKSGEKFLLPETILDPLRTKPFHPNSI